MSTILKALRRLELEKSAQEGRPLKDEVTAAPDESRRGFPLLWTMIAAGAVGLGLGTSVLWLWPREGERPPVAAAAQPALPAAPARVVAAAPPPVPVVAAPAPVAPGPASPPIQVPAPAPAARMAPDELAPEPTVASPPPPEAYASPVEVIARPDRGPAFAPEEELDGPAEQQPPPRGSVPPFSKRRATASAEAPPAVPLARVEKSVRVEKPAATRAPVEEPATEEDFDEPAIEEPLDEVAPPAAPSLLVSSTVWHPQADRRSAMVSLEGGPARELHEGDMIGSLIVSEIGPSSVVFMSDGAPLRRRVGARD